MADEKKVKIDIASVTEVGEKLSKEIADGFKKGTKESVDQLDSKAIQEKLSSAFSVKGIRETFGSTLKASLGGVNKQQKKQQEMAGLLKKNAELSKSFTSAITSGASKTEIMTKGLGLAKNQIAGMVKNINPYVLALKVGVEAVKQFVKYYQQVAQESSKFITAGSLFADKATMSMMQRTGQGASGAQGTNRALERLGLSFEDLQSGMMTQAQMKMFEQIRKEETERLETIAKVGGPVFESMQYAAVAVAGAVQKAKDGITYAFAKSRGVMQFAKSLEEFANTIGDVIWDAMKIVTPIVNVIGTVLGSVIKVVNIAMNIIREVLAAVSPVFDVINEIVSVVSQALDGILSTIGRIISAYLKPAFKVITELIKIILAPVQYIIKGISGIIEAIFIAIEPLVGMVEMMSDMMTAMVPMTDVFSQLEPILNIVVNSIKLLGAAIGWILGKFAEGIKWAMEMIVKGLDWGINLIPKAFYSLVAGIISIINQIPLVDIKMPEYKKINIGQALTGLGNSIGNAVTAIQGDTFNYNNYNNQNTTTQPTANQNLFQNIYTIVND